MQNCTAQHVYMHKTDTVGAGSRQYIDIQIVIPLYIEIYVDCLFVCLPVFLFGLGSDRVCVALARDYKLVMLLFVEFSFEHEF